MSSEFSRLLQSMHRFLNMSKLEKLHNLAMNNGLSKDDCEELAKFIEEESNKEWYMYTKEKLIYMLADMYAKGIGVKKNHQKAFELYKSMAKEGRFDACYKLFLSYRDGNEELNIKSDIQKAIEWCFISSDYGRNTLLYFLGLKVAGKPVLPYFDLPIEEDVNLAIKCFEKLISIPDVFVGIFSDVEILIHDTVYELHKMSDHRADGDELDDNIDISVNLWKHMGYYHITVESTHIFNLLGSIYCNNNDVRNYKSAKNLFEQAVKLGSLDGEINLSNIYFNGLGVTPNKEKAFELRKHVADLVKDEKFYGVWDVAFADEWKILKTIEDVAEAYHYGIGVQQSYTEALKWYSFIKNNYWTIHISEDLKNSILCNATKAIQTITPLIENSATKAITSGDNKIINLDDVLLKSRKFALYFDSREIDILHQYLLEGESYEEIKDELKEIDENLGKHYPEYEFFFHPSESI